MLRFLPVLLVLSLDGALQAQELVRDINVGPDGSGPQEMVSLGSTVVFAAFTEDEGTELWRTNGEENGTQLVLDLFAGPVSSYPDSLVALGSLAIFRTEPEIDQGILWRTDGTGVGTYRLEEPKGISPWNLERVGGHVYFSADGPGELSLWRTDGTIAGTEVVDDLCDGVATGGQFGQFTAVERMLFFRLDYHCDEIDLGAELFASDGTPSGTGLVQDINPGPEGSLPWTLTAWTNKLLFRADDGTHGTELWVSDGTSLGTQMVLDIAPGAGSSYPCFLVAGSSLAWFVADDGEHGAELWRTDGTAEGTEMVKDVDPGPESGLWMDCADSERTPAVSGETLYFWGRRDGIASLWKSDGTERGTVPIAEGLSPEWIIPAPGGVYFTSQAQTWFSDGTSEGTEQLTDFDGLATTQQSLVLGGGELLLDADDGIFGSEPWLVQPAMIFADGFESGDTSAWDVSVD